jgi:hypothetical protein
MLASWWIPVLVLTKWWAPLQTVRHRFIAYANDESVLGCRGRRRSHFAAEPATLVLFGLTLVALAVVATSMIDVASRCDA